MMDLKRVLVSEEEEDEVVGDGELVAPEAKRRRTYLHSMKEAMGAQYMQSHLPKLEPFLRRVVQEEVLNVLCRHIDSNSTHRIPLQINSATGTKRYKLQFQGNLLQILFTGNRIEAENKHPLRIVLIDAVQNQIITSGPLSSAKVEILVLDGDFGAEEQVEYTAKEFSESIVFEREGKRPLLSGEVMITLDKGVGSIRDVAFTDNSSWIRSRKFRLGARLSRVICTKERVQEAVSNPFLVKDHRGEVYKKHHPPALLDDVWRLEKIGKDGVFHRRLAEFGIYTVQDFLRNLVMDSYGLRSLLGSGMSNKMWEATVEHARECILDDKLCSYCSEQGIILLFNCIYELIGAIFGNSYYTLNLLNPTQKALVIKLQQDAYKFPNRILEFKEQTNCIRLSPTVQAPLVPMSSLMNQQILNLPLTNQGESTSQLGLLEDVLRATDTIPGQQHSEPWIASFGTSSFDARDPFDTQLANSQPCGLLLADMGTRL